MARTHGYNKSKHPTSWLTFKFRSRSQTGKTKIWTVHSISDINEIGIIKWYGRWRGYAFYPDEFDQIIFEQKCLREIADFLEKQNRLTRQSWAKRKKK